MRQRKVLDLCKSHYMTVKMEKISVWNWDGEKVGIIVNRLTWRSKWKRYLFESETNWRSGSLWIALHDGQNGRDILLKVRQRDVLDLCKSLYITVKMEKISFWKWDEETFWIFVNHFALWSRWKRYLVESMIKRSSGSLELLYMMVNI
jgi:hypothetical protein